MGQNNDTLAQWIVPEETEAEEIEAVEIESAPDPVMDFIAAVDHFLKVTHEDQLSELAVEARQAVEVARDALD